ncbi:MAG: hypothetical protein LJE70_03165 [Chromatiaceae bacterium]|nr:hypothetical protein [Chromatiaceae bacterium]
MSHSLHTKLLLQLLGASALLIGPIQAEADAPAAGDDWQYAASLYFFAPAIKGTTASGTDVDVGFDTLFDNLNMTFMGAFEARKSKWSALADVLYLNVGANEGATVPVTTPAGANLGLEVDTSLKVRGWVLSFLGGYNVYDTPQASVDVIAGARYLELKLDFDLGLQSRAFGRPIEAAASGAVWDGVIGVRGQANLQGNWYLPFYLDAGTGESDLTWQALGGVGYRFDWGNLNVVYRYMKWDFDSGSAIDDISFSGPQLTATFRF